MKKKIIFDIIIKKKFFLFILFFLNLVNFLCEIFILSFIFPFITLIISPEILQNNLTILKVASYFGINIVIINLYIVFLFVALILFSGLFKILLQYYNIKVVNILGLEFSNKLYKFFLNLNYLEFIKFNSSEIITMLTRNVEHFSTLLFYCFLFFTNIVLLSAIIIFCIFFIPVKILYAVLCIVILYLILGLFIRKKINIISLTIANYYSTRENSIKQSIGYIRELILDNSRNSFLIKSNKLETEYRNSNALGQLISTVPKIFIETLVFILVVIFSFYSIDYLKLSQNEVLSYLGVVIYALFRILPIAQNIYGAWAIIAANKEPASRLLNFFDTIHHLDDHPEIIESDLNNIIFFNHLNFNNVSFEFLRDNISFSVLEKINFEITKGEVIGIVGETGSGKSTLLDLISGIIKPTNGSIFINNSMCNYSQINSWRANISVVPQQIYILNDTIIRNISLNSEITKDLIEKIIQICKLACLDEFINSLPNKYHTVIGENGIDLSGGQRQRFGIARALFKNRQILILDEATSALDVSTEKKIIENIISYYKYKTIIISTHKQSNLTYCTQVYLLKNRSLEKIV
jgi:ABC-type multidrug transport system fused ATPase/permease subunit